jgi:quinol monooxygenase YgiN
MKPSKSDLVVVASARAKPGKEMELEQALRAVAGPTRSQPGSIAFGLYRAVQDPAALVAFERWASREDHDRHLRGPHVQTLMSAMATLLADAPRIVEYEIVDEE